MTRYNTSYAENEKTLFSEQRSLALNKSDKNRNQILELEKKFGKVCFTPLAVPKIEDSDFYTWFFDRAKPSVKQNQDIATDYTGGSSFLSIDVVPDWYDTSKSVWSKNVITDFNKQWPKLWQQFYDYLPFDKIVGLSIWSSTKDIIAHRDQSLFLDLPLEFRVLMDTNPNFNLSVSEVLPNNSIENKLQTTNVPNNLDTNCFAWSNLRSQHHSVYDENYKKIIFIFHYTNKINWVRYEQLLANSLLKYPDYAMISNKEISDYIHV